jgi:hypothetical protein
LQVLQIGQLLATGFAGPNASLLQDQLRRGAMQLTQVQRPPVSGDIISTPTPPPLSPCANGSEYASQTDNSGGVQVWINTYYDAGCTEIYSKLYNRLTLINQSGSVKTTAINGTQQFFLINGTQVSYTGISGQLVVNGTQIQQVSEQVATAQSQSAQPNSVSGLACIYTNGAASSCGSGSIT